MYHLPRTTIRPRVRVQVSYLKASKIMNTPEMELLCSPQNSVADAFGSGGDQNSASPHGRDLAKDSERSHVIVVEDNRSDVFLVREAVALHGLSVDLHVFENGKLACDFLESGNTDMRPSLFLIDLNLPIRNGLEVLALIRSSAFYCRVPVLIMTSSDSPEERAEAKRLGADGYFLKPFSYDHFLEIGKEMRELLRRIVPARA